MATAAPDATTLRGTAPPSPAGPLEAPDPHLPLPPRLPVSVSRQSLSLAFGPYDFLDWARRTAGDVFTLRIGGQPYPLNVSCHPDHVKALFLAKPDDAPSLTADSPVRPFVGPDTVLTARGARHLRQRRLLLPSFHGDAIAAYTESIERAIDRELDTWRQGQVIDMAHRMSSVTLDVIMAGVFGFEGRPQPGSPEAELRRALRAMNRIASRWWFVFAERPSQGHDTPRPPLSWILGPSYRAMEAIIASRRAMPEAERGADVLSLLLSATDEDGARLTDYELRQELMTLVLAGHETTANSLAWACERLTRTPAAYDRLRELVRAGGEDAEAYVDATVHESMRIRPVVPMAGRLVRQPWRLGDVQVPAGSAVMANMVLLQRREDLYPQPMAFLPERFLGQPAGTYEWIPFGGGTRSCLGAALAMAEQRVVLRELARRFDLSADRPQPERARVRNVVVIPSRGGRVRVERVVA